MVANPASIFCFFCGLDFLANLMRHLRATRRLNEVDSTTKAQLVLSRWCFSSLLLEIIKVITLQIFMLPCVILGDKSHVAGHIQPKMSGPYKVLTILKDVAYELTDLKGRILPRPWNVNNLKQFCTWEKCQVSFTIAFPKHASILRTIWSKHKTTYLFEPSNDITCSFWPSMIPWICVMLLHVLLIKHDAAYLWKSSMIPHVLLKQV